MLRISVFCLIGIPVLACGAPVVGQPGQVVPPTVYELLIDGESFLVEANRAVKLQSKEQPGVSYQVALRVATTQRLRLNSVQFEYDWLNKVEDTGTRPQRSVRLTHELGFNMRIAELGGPLEPKAQDEALKILTETLVDTYKQMKVAKLTVGKPQERKFEGTAGRGVVIRYNDAQEFGHTSLVYVLAGQKFTVSCIVQYLDNDSDDVLPLIRKTLDSFRPAQ